jgi:hypothetical protein
MYLAEIYLILSFFFLVGAGDQTQGLVNVRQVLYLDLHHQPPFITELLNSVIKIHMVVTISVFQQSHSISSPSFFLFSLLKGHFIIKKKNKKKNTPLPPTKTLT